MPTLGHRPAFKSPVFRIGFLSFYLFLAFSHRVARAQDYDVSEIRCTFGSPATSSTSPSTTSPATTSTATSGSGRDSISARLRKPDGFKGSPLFADDRSVDPLSDKDCQIRPDPHDPNKLLYNLLVTDFTRCGVLRRNDFVHLRVWFPQFPGVVMMSDQELIIMCKPPEPTIIENKAAGFAGSFPHGARVSGVVEETPGRLEYEVALYKEAPTRVGAQAGHIPSAGGVGNVPPGELPVDQAVPIGTKLQLRARINPDSAWKFLKLMEVTVSPDPDDAHVVGSVPLVIDGCRNREFSSIIPHQPARYRDRHNEVFLDFEAFLLSTMRERSTLWIHSQIKACMDAADCQPDYCLDLFEPAGHGKRRRRDIGRVSSGTAVLVARRSGRAIRAVEGASSGRSWRGSRQNNTLKDQSARFDENIEYSVLMPGELLERTASDPPCSTLLAVSAGLGALLVLSACLSCYLTARLHGELARQIQNKSLDILVRERSRRRSSAGIVTEVGPGGGYTGRNTVH